MGCCSSSTNEIDNQEYNDSSKSDSVNVSLGDSIIETLYENTPKRIAPKDLPLSSSRLRSTSFSGKFVNTQGEGTIYFSASTQSNSFSRRGKNSEGFCGELMQHCETYN